MGKLSRYDGGDLPDDKRSKKRSSSATRAVLKKDPAKAAAKKPKPLYSRIRDVRRLMMKFTDEENQKRLQERLDALLQKQSFKTERKQEVDELRVRITRSKKARLIEFKKLEKKLKRTEDENTRELLSNDLEYIRSYPKAKEYLPLFDAKISDKDMSERDELRKEAALRRMQGKGTEATGMGDLEEDDFFASADDASDDE
jgi:hypothetical protein